METMCVRYSGCWDSLHLFGAEGEYLGDVNITEYGSPGSTGHRNDHLRCGRAVHVRPTTDSRCLARVESIRPHLPALRRGETVRLGSSALDGRLETVPIPQEGTWREYT